MLKKISDLLKNLERREDSTVICDTLYSVKDLKESLLNIMFRLKEVSKVSSIGIRLYDPDINDYPYYIYDGFTKEFIHKEYTLCKSEKCNIYDECGKSILECMCGYVLEGNFKGNFSFITEKGSFWTNNSSILIKCEITEEFKIDHSIRDTCFKEGFESLAMVPIRISDDKIIGLVQFNDKNRDMFTLEIINYFEILCDLIGLRIQSDLLKGQVLKFDEINGKTC
jgi:hypothetical protein